MEGKAFQAKGTAGATATRREETPGAQKLKKVGISAERGARGTMVRTKEARGNSNEALRAGLSGNVCSG